MGGYLIKLILFIIVFSWLFRTISKILLGRFYRKVQQEQQFSKQRQTKRPADGNVDINFSDSGKKNRKTPDHFKGGDYVDYEEIE